MTPWTRLWLPAIVVVLELFAPASARSAQYAVEGSALGAPVNSQILRTYNCKPSEDFADLTWCERSQQRKSRGRGVTVSSTIAFASNGAALYLMANAAPLVLNKAAIENEIVQLAREIGEQPSKIQWHSGWAQTPPLSVIVYWGKIRLEPLSIEDVEIIRAGKSPRIGVLVDTLGDMTSSAANGSPIYRITGGPGFIYSASFDERGQGHRHYVAIDPAQLNVKHFQAALTRILQADKSLPADDYHLWGQVAAVTRTLARDTSAQIANTTLDQVFANAPSKKLRSHVWSILPGGAIEHMAMHQYGTIDIYGPKTEHPEIRRTIQRFLADHPSEPFAELLHYVIGDYEKALQANPNSVISDVVHYAIGFNALGSLSKEALSIVNPPKAPDDFVPDTVDGTISFLNEVSDRGSNKSLSAIIPNFAARAAIAKPHFEAVLRNPSSRHADDAAYMLGWIAMNEGDTKEALRYFSQALVVGNGDYKLAAIRRTISILLRYSPREQIAMIEGDRNFDRQPVLWYVAARSAYRELDYALTIDAAKRALKAMNVPLDRLPATTDPNSIDEALQKINPNLDDDLNLREIPYLLEASREMSQYIASLTPAERPDALAKRSRAIILKYSKLTDDREQSGERKLSTLSHRDLRQAVHLVDETLQHTPKTAQYERVREWLYYHKVRVLTAFAPEKVAETVTAMQQEYPHSALLDDALAEEIYAQGIGLKDVNAAQNTFSNLVQNFPTANAVDNAYTWMAIIYRCSGMPEKAQAINREIIRRFPMTRHALYAVKRMANPTSCGLSN